MHRRGGFTLLEMLLAMGIAVVLLAGLYVAVDTQLRFAQVGRETVEQATLARALLASIGNEIKASLTITDPSRYKKSGGSGSGGSSGGGSTGGTPGATPGGNSGTPGAGGSTGGNSGGTTSPASTATDPTLTGSDQTTGLTTSVVIPPGVVGDSSTLTLYSTKLPREIFIPINPDDVPPTVSDIRRISYWLVGGIDNPVGLARQETKQITSMDDLAPLEVGAGDEERFIVAREVVALEFQYFDGVEWQTSWDSSTLGADGTTPIGPPRAIAITMQIARRDEAGRLMDGVAYKTYRHVVAIPTADGPPQSATTGTAPTTGTTGTTPSTGSTGGGTTP